MSNNLHFTELIAVLRYPMPQRFTQFIDESQRRKVPMTQDEQIVKVKKFRSLYTSFSTFPRMCIEVRHTEIRRVDEGSWQKRLLLDPVVSHTSTPVQECASRVKPCAQVEYGNLRADVLFLQSLYSHTCEHFAASSYGAHYTTSCFTQSFVCPKRHLIRSTDHEL